MNTALEVKEFVERGLRNVIVGEVNRYVEDRLQTEVRAAVKVELAKVLKELGSLV